MKINREQLLQMHKETCDNARTTMEKKNKDYTGGSTDIFLNFRSADFVGVDPRKGLLMRTMDKIQRLRTFIDTGLLATDSVNDSIEDIINYMILLKGMMYEDTPERVERKS